MKAWSRSIAILFILALAPAGAAAQSTEGFYASLGGMYVLPSESNASDELDDWKLTGKVPLENGPGFVAAIGYETRSGLRAEIEIGYRTSSWDKFEDLHLTYDGEEVLSDDLEAEAEGDLTTMSMMANGIYAFDASWSVRPYIGVGVGFAKHEVSVDDLIVTVDGAEYEFEDDSSDDTVFAYQVMVGFAYPFSEQAEARLGYRYFATGEADFDGTEADYGSHNVEAGILFRF
ncbi:MAG: porin family protein [Alphaproteobacteria bacterium]|nr:porin family protein [Alphaproteobacteria bacterium]